MSQDRQRTQVIDGFVMSHGALVPGYVVAEGDTVVEKHLGECTERADMTAVMVSDVINSHTHCADYGLRIPPGLSLEELVAPPCGLKHVYLRDAPREALAENMAAFARDSSAFGSSAFIDFREGGLVGCSILRASVPDAVILGRPTSPDFDPEEVESILDVSDGMGISSISDMDHGYVEQVADAVRERQGIFAIHVSERIREDIDFVLSLDPAFVVHMCEATDEDLLKCAEAEVPVVVCPRSNAYFGKVPPVSRMLACGVDVALGTDNGMLCEPDMRAEAAVLADILHSQKWDAEGVWPTLSPLKSKILNRHKPYDSSNESGRLTVLPYRGRYTPESVLRSDAHAITLKEIRCRRM